MKQVVLLDAKTATATSSGVAVGNYRDITLQFIAASISSGNGVFTVDGSNDGTNWVTGIAFLDVTATASATFVVSKTLSANGSGAGYIPHCGFKMLRAGVTVTTDGTYSCILTANKIA